MARGCLFIGAPVMCLCSVLGFIVSLFCWSVLLQVDFEEEAKESTSSRESVQKSVFCHQNFVLRKPKADGYLPCLKVTF